MAAARISASVRGSSASACHVSLPSKRRLSVGFGGAGGEVVESGLLGRDRGANKLDVASIRRRKLFDILCEARKHMNARGVVIADMEHGHRRIGRQMADAMLVGEAVEATGGAHFDAERIGDARKLRDHAGGFAPDNEAAPLLALGRSSRSCSAWLATSSRKSSTLSKKTGCSLVNPSSRIALISTTSARRALFISSVSRL